MTAGLPGTGIGGLFYLVSALLMPFVTLFRAMRGRPVAPGEAFRQAATAVGILVAMWCTGLGLAMLHIDDAGAARLAELMRQMFIAPAMLALAVLGTVVVTVETVALIARLRQRLGGVAGPGRSLPLGWPPDADGRSTP